MDEANKNVVKEKMGLKSVPFLCVVGKVRPQTLVSVLTYSAVSQH
jgi:hypothetical protein